MVDDAVLPYRLPRSAATQANTFVEGVVFDVAPAGMRFTIPEWDNGRHVFGPAPWPASRVEPADHHAEATPRRGARALVLFLGEGIERPWILGWW